MVKIKTPNASGTPDALQTWIYSDSSGWAEGIPKLTEDYDTVSSTLTKERWVWNETTQENTSLSYIQNPRMTDVHIYDGTNVKHTRLEYLMATGSSTVTQYGLVSAVKVYDGATSTVLKTQVTEYNLDSAYTSRRIIGLPTKTEVWSGASTTLMSKTTYSYDDGDFTNSGLSQNVSPTHHDGTNYGSSFMTGRGLLTAVTRCDALASGSSTCNGGITSHILYNTAGSPVEKVDPLSHTVMIGYTDSFNSSPGVTTNAYPTTITDPEGSSLGDAYHSSTMSYRYDFGANVEAIATPRSGTTAEKKTVTTYKDTTGQVEKQAIWNKPSSSWAEHAYTRYEYPDNGVELKKFTTLIDTTGSTAGPDAADEVETDTWFDGAGRAIGTLTEHPGSATGWAAVLANYDILGRLHGQSVPTEVSIATNDPAHWTPAGDDSARATSGPLYNYTYYDWKGRVIRTIPSDSTGSDGKDTLIFYAGCGCAGGQVTTISGPVTTAVDVGGTTRTTKRRTQKLYADNLGRKYKSEIWDLDGEGSAPYSTVKTTFNALDQATLVRQYDGSDSSSTYQDTTMSYDGYGRLYQSHKPEQRDGTTLKYTTYSYNDDDSISQVTDGRGVDTNYTYNNRRMVTGVGWDVHSTGVTDPTDVTYTFDNACNRTDMSDGLGSVSYSYNSLSQLTSETRTFSDTLADKPTGNFNISYTYEIGGALKSYTDPYGKDIDNTRDKASRLSAITGTSFGGVTTYLNNPAYRAWGAVKHLEYGSGVQADTTYDSSLRPSTFAVNKISDTSIKTFDKSYEYYNDGSLKLSDENQGTTLDKFDRSFGYDHAGRIVEAKSGSEAKGTAETDLTKLPYRQSYIYNAFGNLLSRESTLWNSSGDWDFNYTVANNRVAYRTYDADGRQLDNGSTVTFSFDGAGQMTNTDKPYHYETTIAFDGNGNEGRRSQRVWDSTNSTWKSWETTYLVSSTILGQVVTETYGTGKKKNSYVIGEGSVVAKQFIDDSDASSVAWKLVDPAGLSTRSSALTGSTARFTPEELDGLGNNIGLHSTTAAPENHQNTDSPHDRVTFDDPSIGECAVMGIITPCSMAFRDMHSGGAFIDWSHTDRRVVNRFRISGFAVWNPNSDRTAPELPPDVVTPDDPENFLHVYQQTDGGIWEWRFSISDIQQHTNPNQIADKKKFREQYWKTYGELLNGCIESVFGEDAKKVGRQTLESLPDIDDSSYTKSDLGKKTSPKVPEAAGWSNPTSGKNGLVYFASDRWPALDPFLTEKEKADQLVADRNEDFFIYTHEIGNIKAYIATKRPGKSADYNKYGNKNDPSGDPDTGQALENCVREGIQHMKPVDKK